ncbi:MAG: PAS domain S-box protein, partial [Chloroflexi bacterium]|nr:PAS domain S-box protein [Chloroflexota bacterium]
MHGMRLSVKLPLLIVVTAVVVICAVVLVSFFTTRNSLVDIELEAQTISVNMYASAITFYLDEARSILETTAEQEGLADFVPVEPVDPELHGVPDDKAMLQRNIAKSILKNSDVFDYIQLLKPDGTIYLLEPYDLQIDAISGSRAYADWYKELMSSGDTVVSNLRISNATRKPVVTIATPVRNSDGQLVGIWAGGLSLGKLSKVGLTESQTGPLKQYGYVTDSRGLIIAHQANPRYVQEQTDFSSVLPVQAALAGEQGTMQYISPMGGQNELAAYTPLADTGWAVASVVPTEVAFAPLYRLTLNTAILGIIAVIIMGIGGWAISRQVTRPLQQLTEGAEAIGAGDLSRHIEVTTGDEIGQLASEFNQMAESLADKEAQLREYAAQLEQKVEERTRELQASEEKYRDLVEELPDVVFSVDQNGAMTYLSPAVESMIGYSVSELMGRTFADFLHPDDLTPALENFMRTLSGETVVGELRFFTRSGELRWLRNSNKPIFEKDHVVGVRGVFSDITARKQAEEKLRQTMDELQRSNAELERFAYVASHDLQEPLRMVASYTQLLERRYRDRLDTDATEFINYAVDGARRMQQLINDLLAYSRVGTRGKPFEPTDMEAAFEGALANLQVAIKESKAKVTHDPLPTVMGDDGQLVQVFQNLIHNAIKFRSQKPPVVHISAKRKADDWVFSVKDNGIGIDPQYFDRIFIIFQRLHREDYPGTGIGLSIA